MMLWPHNKALVICDKYVKIIALTKALVLKPPPFFKSSI